jgi:hypothetical protein
MSHPQQDWQEEILGNLLESETLIKQGRSNTNEQFANSPDLKSELVNAIIEALDAHNEMSSQALGSDEVQQGLKDILLGPAKLYEALIGQRHFPRRRCRKSCVVIGVGYVGGRGRRQDLIRVTSIPNASSSAIRDFRWDTRACAFRDW